MNMRTTENLSQGWQFRLADAMSPEESGHGNRNLIANENRTWQKAGNHWLSNADNHHTLLWDKVDLPHDFVLEGDFSPEAREVNGSLHGAEAWYVKRFDLGADDAARRIRIEFDGVYRDCSVFCNGHFVGRHLSGYTSFGFDITEVCVFGGVNAVAVHVDARENELWSYEGGGIYRGVRLVKTGAVFVPQWGVCVRTGGEKDLGSTTAGVEVANRLHQEVSGEVHVEVLDADGTPLVAGQGSFSVLAMNETRVQVVVHTPSPRHWSVDNPVLYTLRCELRVKGQATDRVEQFFGYRTIRFDPSSGFYLNGQALKLKGTCCHQDHGCVGIAVPPALQEWRIKMLKSFGCNALRTSHNPPDPALLDACDRLGMLVIDELRMPGISREQLEEVSSLVRRDRNHPCVILWSVGNEEMGIQSNSTGIRILRRLQHLVHTLDPTRLTTYACNENWIDICDYQRANGLQVGVFGANYRSGQRSEHYDEFHAKHPDWPMLGSETWGGTCTRGLYRDDGIPLEQRWQEKGWLDGRRYVSGYANWCTPWGYTIEETWRDCVKRPHMAGTFVWTGFDYRGEIAPYTWPSVVTRFGVLDLCGYYKEVAHYLRAWWKPECPHVYLMPHWNWEPGEPITVRCYSNAAEVELYVNGRSAGRRRMPRNDRLEWTIEFVAGEIKAIGYDDSGRALAEDVRRTAGEPVGIRTRTEHVGDILIVHAAVIDRSGNVCPQADNLVVFSADGPARLLGVGNGDPTSHERDRGTNQRKAYHGLCQAIYQNMVPGSRVLVTASLHDLPRSSGPEKGPNSKRGTTELLTTCSS